MIARSVKYFADDDGVLSQDEFRKLCAEFAPDLSNEEMKAALQLIDTNKDGFIEFDEFVRFWQKEISGQ